MSEIHYIVRKKFKYGKKAKIESYLKQLQKINAELDKTDLSEVSFKDLLAFKESLELFELPPTQKTRFRVFLRRREDIRRYFDLIGTSNEKHLNKVRDYSLTSERRGRIEV